MSGVPGQAALEQFDRQVYVRPCPGSPGAGCAQQRIDRQFQFTRGASYAGKTKGGAGPGQAVRAALQGRQCLSRTFVVQHLVPEQLDLCQSLGQRTTVISTLQLHKGKKDWIGDVHEVANDMLFYEIKVTIVDLKMKVSTRWKIQVN